MRVREAYRAVRDYGQFTESPRDRVSGIAKEMLVSTTLPNIALGLAVSEFVHWRAGTAPFDQFALSVVAWVVFVCVYGIGDEVVTSVSAMRSAFDGVPKGIE